MAFLIFILILSVLVLVHEFGHYIVAKKLGIRVEEFGLGIPPRVIGKKIGETTYSLNLLPFGGFVKVTGEDISEEAVVNGSVVKDVRSFAWRPPHQRIAVLAAGVFMNIVLAVGLFYVVLGHYNYRTQYIPLIFEHSFKFGQTHTAGTVVSALMPDSTAASAGIKIGENILSVDGVPVNGVLDLRESLKGKLGQNVSVELQDISSSVNGPIRTLVVPTQADTEGKVILGVYVTKAVSLSYAEPNSKPWSGFLHAYNVLDFSLSSFSKLIGLSVKENSITPVSQSVSGPVGIYDMVAGLLKYGGSEIVYQILDFIAIMSLSLALINIMPIPALDGGRILFVAIEKLIGRPVSAKVESAAHRWGFALLITLLVLVTFKDIFN